MQDPSQGVHRDLLAHIHLLSTYRFPALQTVHHNKIAEWLLSAPKIVRDTAPFYWSYLDRPSDGTILLTWQPMDALNALGIQFATDGYMWPPIETAFQLEIEGGFTLEMYQHKSGYGPGEQFATHGRRRYRLMPSKYPNPASATPDPALWITHYYQADPGDRVPSNVIPINDPRTQSLMQTRMYLQTQGQIVQKEFMLHDRTNWPNIQFPRGQVRQPQYSMGATRTPQSMAYPTHQIGMGSLGPPAKRARTQTNPPQSTPSIGAVLPVEAQDDEEDTSRGDVFDHMTPREVSMSRYKQNHEWMEEIMSSPYSIGQITPVDLGMGLRGELSNLTDGIFHAPTSLREAPNGNTGRLDTEKAEEFRTRVTEYTTESKIFMEKSKAKHARRLAKFKKNSLINEGEVHLRHAVHDPEDVGPEYWRIEGRFDENEDDADLKKVSKLQGRVQDIVAQVEASLGKHAVAIQELTRIQDGGLEESQPIEEPQPEPEPAASLPISPQTSQNGSQQSGVLIGDGDLDMGGSAAGLLDQFHTGFSSTSAPGSSFPTPQAHLATTSNNGTPRHDPSPQPSAHIETQQAEAMQADRTMEDMDIGDASKEGQGTGDWVVVPEGGVSPSTAAPNPPTSFLTTEEDSALAPSASEQAPITKAETHNADLDLSLDDNFTTETNDFGSLDDLDTAGEALAGYGSGDMEEHGGDMGGDMDLGMDMGLDDSAFGDAFHGVEPRDGENEGDHL